MALTAKLKKARANRLTKATLKRLSVEGKPKQRKAAQAALNEKQVLDTLSVALVNYYSHRVTKGDDKLAKTLSANEAIGDGTLLECLWENREEIMKFVLSILAAFGILV